MGIGIHASKRRSGKEQNMVVENSYGVLKVQGYFYYESGHTMKEAVMHSIHEFFTRWSGGNILSS